MEYRNLILKRGWSFVVYDPTSVQAGGDLGWFQLDQYGPTVGMSIKASDVDLEPGDRVGFLSYASLL